MTTTSAQSNNETTTGKARSYNPSSFNGTTINAETGKIESQTDNGIPPLSGAQKAFRAAKEFSKNGIGSARKLAQELANEGKDFVKDVLQPASTSKTSKKQKAILWAVCILSALVTLKTTMGFISGMGDENAKNRAPGLTQLAEILLGVTTAGGIIHTLATNNPNKKGFNSMKTAILCAGGFGAVHLINMIYSNKLHLPFGGTEVVQKFLNELKMG